MDRNDLKQLIERYETVNFTVNRRINAMIRSQLEDDLTLDQLTTLRYIRRRGSCKPSEVSDVFCVGKSSVTAIVSRLVDKGLLERQADPKDRRVLYLSATPKADRITDALEEKIQDGLAEYLEHFDESEIQAFITAYEKLGRLMLQDEKGGSLE